MHSDLARKPVAVRNKVCWLCTDIFNICVLHADYSCKNKIFYRCAAANL